MDRVQGNYLYVLRDIGSAAARNVEVDESRIGRGCSFNGPLKPPQIAPQQQMRFKLTYWRPQRPRELWIRWQGHSEWEAVQVPLRA